MTGQYRTVQDSGQDRTGNMGQDREQDREQEGQDRGQEREQDRTEHYSIRIYNTN